MGAPAETAGQEGDDIDDATAADDDASGGDDASRDDDTWAGAGRSGIG
jgi:hypothetical protein